VGLGVGNAATARGEFSDAGEGVPTQSSYLNPTSGPPYQSAIWKYSSGSFAAGGESKILIYESPYGPTLLSATVLAGTASATGSVLSPTVPEPFTLSSLTVAVTLLLSVRWLRRAFFQ